MVTNKRARGRDVEQFFVKFLRLLGYAIIDTNVHLSNRGEIDIVANDGGEIVFIEVRSISSSGISVAEILPRSKQLRLQQLARLWLLRRRLSEYTRAWRIDLLVLNWYEGKIEWLQRVL